MNEKKLIQQAQEGSHDAFLRLIERYDRSVMSVIYRFTCDLYDREDLYQEVFLRCFSALPTYQFKASFSTWLYRIALNGCIDYMKKKPELSQNMMEQTCPEIDWAKRERVQAINKAAKKLSRIQRICFHLHYVEDWKTAEIADLMNKSEGTVKSHLNRARTKIRKDRKVLIWKNS